jgi:predicted metal-dependent HD superfamily phosphohydrolase
MCVADRAWLRQRFLQLAAQLGVDPGQFAVLDSCYSGPHRHYHGWRHIDECLRQLDLVADKLDDSASVEAAIWYHDAVWLPGSSCNEAESAELAWRALLPGNPQRAEKVRDFIRETDYSRPGSLVDRDLDYLKDIDFSPFGKPFEQFWDDVERLQREREHAPEHLRDNGGVLRFYQAILDGRVVLFRTEEFAARFQHQAQENVRRALEALRGTGDGPG